MNYKMIVRILGFTMIIESILMLPSTILSMCDGDTVVTTAYLYTILIAMALAGVFVLLSRKAKRGFYSREGLVCVAMCWILMSLVGALPFCFSGVIPRYVDALFEIASGLSTTGASIIPNVEVLPRALLLWRSMSNWIGGMGVLVFLLAIVPFSGNGAGFTMHILRAESPGPDVGKLTPKMKKTASILYLLYIGLTVLDFIFLLFGGFTVFEASCTAMSTAATGGFGIKADSIASFSPYIQNVCTVFMTLFGINFTCYYMLILRRFMGIFRDEELRFYLCTILIATAAITLDIRSLYESFSETLRHAAFQVSSIITTTGFCTTDFNLWPSFSKAIIMVLMVFGACAGSTGGGMKCSRIMLLIKGLFRNIRRVLRPNTVETVRINGRPMDERVLSNTNAYLSAYVMIICIGYLVISLDGFSMTANFSAVVSCFNNIGPAFAEVGPMYNYAGFSEMSKLVLTLIMLTGRLEIFPILALFSPKTWKRK